MPKGIDISADNIDGAAQGVIGFLERTKAGDVYFNGWAGLGASAVLKAVTKRLKLSPKSYEKTAMGKLIHIDCSLWQSKRALQREIAKELELPRPVMAIFDEQDADDDFDGVELRDRGVIPSVVEAITNHLYDRRFKFLVVFHNGSGNYIDLRECGVPITGVMGKRVLWTSGCSFQFDTTSQDDVIKLAGLSDVALCIVPIKDDNKDQAMLANFIMSLLEAEAQEAAESTAVPVLDLSPQIAMECWLYMAFRSGEYGIDWETHAPNYWVCDGIIHTSATAGVSAWEIGAALQRNMHMNWQQERVQRIIDVIGLSGDLQTHSECWVSATHKNTAEVQVRPQATSFFYTTRGAKNDDSATTMALEARMFTCSESTNKLRVIHLVGCTFSFSSPPFQCCKKLRFLLLDHCKNNDEAVCGRKEEQHCVIHGDNGGGECFRNLWVLDLSYTKWYCLISEKMMYQMTELRELNVKGVKNWSISHLCRGNDFESSSNNKLVKLKVITKTTDTNQASLEHPEGTNQTFPNMANWSILKTIVLGGCVDLVQIGPNTLPPLIESLSFFVNTGVAQIKSISTKGCTQLKNILLRGSLNNLVEVDISGTVVKIFDLSATHAPSLKRLFLLGCEKLCAILWPKEGDKPELEILCIDTCNLLGALPATRPRDAEAVANHTDSYISIKDTRLLKSLLHVSFVKLVHVQISANASLYGACEHSSQGTNSNTGNLYGNASVMFQADLDASMMNWIWSCPPSPYPECSWEAYCSIGMREKTQTKLSDGTTRAATLPDFIVKNARSLHLHDSMSITCIPGPAPASEDLRWEELFWCRLERCPNLEGTVFTAPSLTEYPEEWVRVLSIPTKKEKIDSLDASYSYFWCLDVLWASQLPKAQHIWDWGGSSFRPGYGAFEDLIFLHLDCCPRLEHVLPLCTSNGNGCRRLETLEIVCCGELKEIFPLDSEAQEPRKFNRLKRIHLHELPMLRSICGRRMLAPNLETVKIRGCWSLRRLPAVRSNAPIFPKVDCEKEWWDGLMWDGMEINHDPSLYKLSHSKHYKKTMLRNTVLR